jgi:hypothetical protein
MKRFSGCAIFALAAFYFLSPFNLPRTWSETVDLKLIFGSGLLAISAAVYHGRRATPARLRARVNIPDRRHGGRTASKFV